MSGALLLVLIIAIVYLGFQLLTLWTARQVTERRCREWVEQCHEGEKKGQTREAAIHDLERGLAGLPSHNILRRMGSAAPLLGVVLTVLSMFIESSVLVEAMNSSTPSDGVVGRLFGLGAGVCAGALLALINHALLAILQTGESRFIDRALGAVAPTDFRDADDRLERVISQIRGSGDALEKAAGNLDAMLRNARDAMSGMSESCVEAATQLKSLATFMKGEISPPIEAFVAASTQLKDASLASARDFTTSMKTLSKQVDQLDKRIGDGLERQRVGLQSQVDAANSLAASARELNTSLGESIAPLSNGTAREFAEVVRSVTGELRDRQSTVAEGANAFVANTTQLGERVKLAIEALDAAHASVVRRMRSYELNAEQFGEQVQSTTQALRLAQASVASGASDIGLHAEQLGSRIRTTTEALDSAQASVASGATAFTTRALELGERVSATASALESAPAAVATGIRAFEAHATKLGERVTTTGDLLVTAANGSRERVERELSSLTGEVSALRLQAESLASAMGTLKAQLPNTVDALRGYQDSADGAARALRAANDSSAEGSRAVTEFASAASAATNRLRAYSSTPNQSARAPSHQNGMSGQVDGVDDRDGSAP